MNCFFLVNGNIIDWQFSLIIHKIHIYNHDLQVVEEHAIQALLLSCNRIDSLMQVIDVIVYFL